jgi:UDP-3-O-acyl-N-acetylglucosamine deacetylase
MQSATIAKPLVLEHRGLISGEQCRAVIQPAEPGSGIVLKRGAASIKTDPVLYIERSNCTCFGGNGVEVAVTEHLFAALWAAGIDAAEVELEGPEPPNWDGSALPQYELIREAGVSELGERQELAPSADFWVEDGGAYIRVVPSNELAVEYSFGHPELGKQQYCAPVNRQTAPTELLPARSFITAREAELAIQMGVLKNTNDEDALVITEGVPNSPLRFENEYARHKVLDLVGDLYVLPFELKCGLICYRSGHKLNRMLVRRLMDIASRSQ